MELQVLDMWFWILVVISPPPNYLHCYSCGTDRRKKQTTSCLQILNLFNTHCPSSLKYKAALISTIRWCLQRISIYSLTLRSPRGKSKWYFFFCLCSSYSLFLPGLLFMNSLCHDEKAFSELSFTRFSLPPEIKRESTRAIVTRPCGNELVATLQTLFLMVLESDLQERGPAWKVLPSANIFSKCSLLFLMSWADNCLFALLYD